MTTTSGTPVSVRLQLPTMLVDGLDLLLKDHRDEVVVWSERDQSPPDVLIIDPWAPWVEDRTGIDAPRVALTTETPGGNPRLPRDHGAARAVTLSAEVADLVKAVVEVHDEHRRGKLTQFTIENPLTRREEDVIIQLCRGLSNTDIASELGLGVNTVKTYIRSAYQKIGINSRSQAVLWGSEYGLASSETTQGHTPVTEE